MLLAVFVLSPAGALGAAPGNDNFATRQTLSGALPIEASGSNVEASKEAGEFIPAGPSPAGHSVWYEWEATSTGWVTIGACEDAFRTIVGVFTGTEVDHLTQVASGNDDEGPGCQGQRQFTFKAQAATKYEIAIDGNIFHLPEEPPPVTEGEIKLRIEATPAPANDDFANATTLQASIEEEPGGDRFYYAAAQGYNWTATTESGEPGEGTSSGASVWYRWTAPESAEYRLGGLCCGTGLHWSLYMGDSVNALAPILLGADLGEVWAGAGTTFRVRIYGDADVDTGEPKMASFGFHISAFLPPPPPTPPAPTATRITSPADSVAPETTVSKRMLKRKPPIVRLNFSSSEPGSSFRCSVDGGAFERCGSSLRFSRPSASRRTVRVYAVDPAGNVDPTPATTHFKISPPQRR